MTIPPIGISAREVASIAPTASARPIVAQVPIPIERSRIGVPGDVRCPPREAKAPKTTITPRTGITQATLFASKIHLITYPSAISCTNERKTAQAISCPSGTPSQRASATATATSTREPATWPQPIMRR